MIGLEYVPQVPIRNASLETIPPFAVVEVTSGELDDDGDLICVVNKPADDAVLLLFNGPVPIPAGPNSYGVANRGFRPCVVRLAAGETYSPRTKYGVKSGTWDLEASGSGEVSVIAQVPGFDYGFGILLGGSGAEETERRCGQTTPDDEDPLRFEMKKLPYENTLTRAATGDLYKSEEFEVTLGGKTSRYVYVMNESGYANGDGTFNAKVFASLRSGDDIFIAVYKSMNEWKSGGSQVFARMPGSTVELEGDESLPEEFYGAERVAK